MYAIRSYYAEELAKFHEEENGLSATVVSVDQIYNEFSSGIPDAAGIRNFIRYCYRITSYNVCYTKLLR